MEISSVQQTVDSFNFVKGDYSSAEKQLLNFAENYSRLSVTQAEIVRQKYSSKARLGWFRIAASLLHKNFDHASLDQQKSLLNIFFALYSFQNLDFGYDALMDVIGVSNKIKSSKNDVRTAWNSYKPLTSNANAVENLENKLF